MSTPVRKSIWTVVAVCLAAAAVGVWLATAGGAAAANAQPVPEIIGQPGTGPGCFYRPRGITADLQGRIYNVDQLGRVQVFSPAGQVLYSWTMPEVAVGKPEGMAIDLDGNLLITDTHYSRVITFRPDGTELHRFGRYGTGPGEFTYPLAVAVDRKSGRIYISEYGQDNDRVQIFSRSGEFIKSFGGFGLEPGRFRRPSGLALGPDGQVYVADAVNHRVQVFTAEGEFLRSFGQYGTGAGELAFPYDVAVTPANQVVVCEFGNNRVQAFTPEGVSLGRVGQAGDRPGQLGTPWCLTLEPAAMGTPAESVRVVVSDTLNHRLCRWRLEQILQSGRDGGADGGAGGGAPPGTAGAGTGGGRRNG